MEELKEILASIPGSNLVSDAMLTKALQQARIPDKDGRMPGDVAYIPTYDAYYAAASLVGFLRAQPAVTSAGSEGTNVSTTPYDWDSLLSWLYSMSPIKAASQSDVFTVIPIPSTHRKYRKCMEGDDYYGHDTDIS